MKTLLKNARILTMKDDNIFFGDVSIEDGIIKEVGKVNQDEHFDEVVDCEGNLLMPGFKNAHAHSSMTFLRSVADDSSLEDWLFKEIFPREANIVDGSIYDLGKVALLEYLTSGITSIMDQYFLTAEFRQLCLDFGFRCVVNLMYDKNKRPYDFCMNAFNTWNKDPNSLVKMTVSMHAEYTSDEEMIAQNKRLLEETQSPFYTHLGETLNEVNDCVKRRGMTAVQYLNSLHFFDNGGAIFHGIYLTKEDRKIIKDKDVVIVTCPGSNMKLASGVADISGYLKEGITVALGTDGPASNNGLDMFKEMYLVTGLQKLLHKNPVSIPAFEVLKMATVNGAKAMGLENGKYLEPGSLADIIMIDMSRPSMQPINNIINNLVYSGSKDVIKMTMINGKILYFDGKFRINEDISAIYKKAQEWTEKLKIIKKQEETGEIVSKLM